jgi:hypothetical protein
MDCIPCVTATWCDLAGRCLAECSPGDDDAPLRAVYEPPAALVSPPPCPECGLVAEECMVCAPVESLPADELDACRLCGHSMAAHMAGSGVNCKVCNCPRFTPPPVKGKE